MSNKRNVVLYLDKELIRKTRELGFNLSKTVENHLKQLIIQFSNFNQSNTSENRVIVGSPRDHRLGYNLYFLAEDFTHIILFFCFHWQVEAR